MGRKGTLGTRQLVVDMEAGLRDRLDARVAAEERTLRKVVERAIAFYLDNAPVNGAPIKPAEETPEKSRSRKPKGD